MRVLLDRLIGDRLNGPGASRWLTIGYVVALVVVGTMALGAHLVLREVIAEQESTATVVNTAAHQSTLSQRIALLTERYAAAGRVVDRQDLLRAIERMERDHHALTRGDPTREIPGTVPSEIRAIYFEQPHELDRRVVTFLNYARMMLDLGALNPDVREAAHTYIRVEARGPLPESLEAVSNAYEARSLARIETLRMLQDVTLVVIVLTLIAEGLLIFRPLVSRVRRDADRLYELAMTDMLTGVNNRRAFMDLAGRELARCLRHGHPLCVLMLDIDRFKSVNDTYGHAVGDEAIKHLAQVAESMLRTEDGIGRMGGEEFAIVLPQTQQNSAWQVAERIRAKVEATILTATTGEVVPFTVSVGLARVGPGETSVEPALNRADEGLYVSKRNGRNQVTAIESPSDEAPPALDPAKAVLS